MGKGIYRVTFLDLFLLFSGLFSYFDIFLVSFDIIEIICFKPKKIWTIIMKPYCNEDRMNRMNCFDFCVQ